MRNAVYFLSPSWHGGAQTNYFNRNLTGSLHMAVPGAQQEAAKLHYKVTLMKQIYYFLYITVNKLK